MYKVRLNNNKLVVYRCNIFNRLHEILAKVKIMAEMLDIILHFGLRRNESPSISVVRKDEFCYYVMPF